MTGRERMALEEFASYVQWANQLKSDGEIERFENYGTRTGNMQTFSGFSLLEGAEDKIETIAASESFRKRIIRCTASVQNLITLQCDVGAKMAERMQLYGKTLKEVGL